MDDDGRPKHGTEVLAQHGHDALALTVARDVDDHSRAVGPELDVTVLDAGMIENKVQAHRGVGLDAHPQLRARSTRR